MSEHLIRKNVWEVKRPRIIFFVESYFQQRDYQRYGVDALLAAGVDVAVWETFRPFKNEYANAYYPSDPAAFSGLRHFRSIREIVQAIGQLGVTDTLFLPWAWADSRSHSAIFREITRRNLNFGTFVMGTVPVVSPRRNRFPSVRQLVDRLYAQIPNMLRRTRPWGFVLLCGGDILASCAEAFPHAQKIWTHTWDYDLVLEARDAPEVSDSRHIVFLDEYVPFHPDYVANRRPPPNTAAEYYPKLTGLFTALERQLGLPVIIAAHPRSKYNADRDYFGGRPVVRGETCALVKNAALVLTHCSISNNFTVAFRKPALILSTDGLRSSFYGPYIAATAIALGAPTVDLDRFDPSVAIEIPKVCEDRYQEFHRLIIKRIDSADENTWRTVARYVLCRDATIAFAGKHSIVGTA
jgi:hypothetical protein